MWATCKAGHPHWGRYGAAGLLLVDSGRVLLQHRSRHVHQGGTWSIPGGAREPWETAWEAALREAGEETGIRPGDIEQVGEHIAECHGWYYTTEIARPLRSLSVAGNLESHGHRWVPLGEVPALPLHPAFAAAWPDLTAWGSAGNGCQVKVPHHDQGQGEDATVARLGRHGGDGSQ